MNIQHEITCESCSTLLINEAPFRCHTEECHEFYYERETDRTQEYHQANTHEISTRKLLSEQSRIRQLFDEDSNFKEVIQIDKYTAIGEVEDGVTNAIGDIAIRHETHYNNHTKARNNTK